MNAPRIPILPVEVQRRLDDELRSGEKVVWAGQPIKSVYFLQGLVISVFGLFFGGFALFGSFAAPMEFKLFLIPFLLIGGGLVLAPLWMGIGADRTVYAITNERAIIIKGSIFNSVNVYSYGPDRLISMTRTERASGNGNLIFEQFTQRVGSGTSTTTRGFMAIEHVRDVENILTQTLLANRNRPTPGSPA